MEYKYILIHAKAKEGLSKQLFLFRVTNSFTSFHTEKYLLFSQNNLFI